MASWVSFVTRVDMAANRDATADPRERAHTHTHRRRRKAMAYHHVRHVLPPVRRLVRVQCARRPARCPTQPGPSRLRTADDRPQHHHRGLCTAQGWLSRAMPGPAHRTGRSTATQRRGSCLARVGTPVQTTAGSRSAGRTRPRRTHMQVSEPPRTQLAARKWQRRTSASWGDTGPAPAAMHAVSAAAGNSIIWSNRSPSSTNDDGHTSTG